MELWFTSDTHFGHRNILKFLRPDGVTPMRGFVSVEEMDETLVQRWNEVVRPADHIYHLGDVAMKRPNLKIVERLKGHKRLIFGNHDIYDYTAYTEVGFKKLMSYRVLDEMIFSHIPLHPASRGRFRGNVHGHIHTNGDMGPGYLNICVEVTNYRPLALSEIRERLHAKNTEGQ